ncbi:histidine phosphatase family protein [Chloroflexota bacterium]
MQLYFIRHGQSENNLLWAQTGSFEGRSEDPGLTHTGRQQAEALAQFLAKPGPIGTERATDHDPQNLAGFAVTHLYCSLMVRAVATATILSRALNLPLVAWQDLHEVGGIHHKDVQTGERIGLPGKNRDYFETYHPELILPESLGQDGWWNRPHEDRVQSSARARRFLSELLEKHGGSDDRVAVVSHGGFFGYLMRAVLDLPEVEGPWFTLNNAAITRIDFDGEWTWLTYMNRASFLPPDLIT